MTADAGRTPGLEAEAAAAACPGLQGVRSGRRESMSRGVEEIRADLESRRLLHESIRAGLEADLAAARLDRAHLENWGTGCEPSVDARKSAVDRQISDARQAIIGEDLAYWRDTAALHRELREALDAEQTAAAGDLLQGGGGP